MTLQMLTTFLAILETGSLVRAAERLNVTQSTVTARLKALEDALGERLINRLKSGAEPTGAGLRLRPYAETIVGLWGQARHHTSLPSSVGSVCNFGCELDLWQAFGEQVPGQILDSDPDGALTVTLGSEAELLAALRSGRIDLVLTYADLRAPGITVHALPPERLVLVSDRAGSPIRFDPGYVYVEAGEIFARQHAVAYADAGTARISFGSAEPALRHLLQRGGSAYLPWRLVSQAIADERLHLLDDAPVFERERFMIFDQTAAEGWDWLADVQAKLERV